MGKVRGWTRRALALASLTAGASCGRSAGDGEAWPPNTGVSSAGAGAVAGNAGASGSASGAGGGFAAASGAFVNGTGGSLTAGNAGSLDPGPEPTACDWEDSQASCTLPCVISYAKRLSCPGPLVDVQLADTSLLLGWLGRSAGLTLQQIFVFAAPRGELSSDRHFGPDARHRLLVRDADQDVVIEDSATGFAISPFPSAAFPGAGLPLAARIDDGTLHLLTKLSASTGQPASAAQLGAIHELSVDRAGSVLDRAVYPAAPDAHFIAGAPATSLLLNEPSGEALAPPYLSKTAPFYLVPGELAVRAVANGDALALTWPSVGAVEVRDQDGGFLLQKGSGAAANCPATSSPTLPICAVPSMTRRCPLPRAVRSWQAPSRTSRVRRGSSASARTRAPNAGS